MYLKRLSITNTRGFGTTARRFDLDFDRANGQFAGWTVLAGRNGAGKTTALQSIALAYIGSRHAFSLRRRTDNWSQDRNLSAQCTVRYVFSDDDKPNAPDVIYQRIAEQYPFTIKQENDGTFTNCIDVSNFPQDLISSKFLAETFLKSLPSASGSFAPPARGCFIAGFGAGRYIEHEGPGRPSVQVPSPVERLASLFSNAEPMDAAISWLQSVNYRKLEGDNSSDLLERQIISILNNDLLPDGTKITGVSSKGVTLTEGRVVTSLRDVGAGYQIVTGMVVTLLMELAASFGSLNVVTAPDGTVQVLNSGVVLIDEVDLHLHVSWQQRIGFWLKEHFPRIQFLVTTHSPFVCQAADPKGLIRLPAPGEERDAEHVSEELFNAVVNGSVDDAVLTELFGLEHSHSPASEKLRNEVAALEAQVLRGKASSDDKQRLIELRAKLPRTPSADVDAAFRAALRGR